jgi:hypothetical protein
VTYCLLQDVAIVALHEVEMVAMRCCAVLHLSVQQLMGQVASGWVAVGAVLHAPSYIHDRGIRMLQVEGLKVRVSALEKQQVAFKNGKVSGCCQQTCLDHRTTGCWARAAQWASAI